MPLGENARSQGTHRVRATAKADLPFIDERLRLAVPVHHDPKLRTVVHDGARRRPDDESGRTLGYPNGDGTSGPGTTIFIDEAQGLNSEAQYVLLTALSEGIVRVPGFVASGHRYAMRLAPFTMILATTHEYLLQEALRDRMRIHCRFDYYSVEDLVEVVRQRAVALRWQYESDEVLQMIARRAKAMPRQALHRNLQTCWEVAVSHDRNIITLVDAQEAFHHMEIDELGLDETDRRYLSILARGGPAPLGTLSAKLGLPPLTVQGVIEPYLIREDLITKGKSSTRILTDKGRGHIETTAWLIR
ncbi:Holliday junction DNA helicase RuvB C-terminal domain-containing protein [Anaerobaca lacustris]|uniref:Holliday junction DNA helicase RuvB C-terminal domain-containing protein n=1 Tax=Anaerobaca lacustris TaxID=3044600 RepID=A0AAW6U0M6_9BACT|nr:Holliday junction DNA helicase RuvB C-terminal domain-containing protein [Sedimentisphaerales bacterium M17dextr]